MNYLWSTPPSMYNPATRTGRWDVGLTPGTNTVVDLVRLYSGQLTGLVTNTAAVLWGSTVWQRASATVTGRRYRVYLPLVVRDGP